ncbi:MAG: hypothetical protein DWQ44_07345 [Bacteroidetes bacterium]|nr:MAG: hypothetical protein DWQ44_07345 [Bacteroidota bacterium]
MKHFSISSRSAVLCFSAFLLSYLNANSVWAQLSSYTFSSLTGVSLETLNSPNTLIFSANDDATSTVQNIPFLFTFNGATYSQFSVNSNGLMKLGPTVVNSSGNNLLTNATDFPKISPYWDDLATGTTGYVQFQVLGTSPNRKLVVEWRLTVPKNVNGSANATCQAWLSETSNIIQFVYGSGFVSNSLNAGYSIGLAASASSFWSVNTTNNTASSSVENNGNIGAITAGRSYRFSPPVATGIPACATNYLPANLATGVNLNPTLSWAASTGVPSGYDVYFGNTPTPPIVSSNQASTNYTTPTLNWNTTYYYQIVPRNSFGPATGCPVISFTTAPLLSFDVVRNTGITFNSITSTGNSITAWKNTTNNTDDNLSEIVPIGFNFTYQAGSYSSFLVSTNGFITFNTSTTATGSGSNTPYNYNNANISSTGSIASPAIVAPFYEDLVTQGDPGTLAGLTSSIHYLTSGSAGSRVLTVQWTGMETWNNSGPNLTFQVKLYEGSNNIEFVYGQMEGFNGTTNYSYTYSSGLNAISISSTLQAGELFTQMTHNTRNFGGTPTNNLNAVPDCFSSILFTPGSYTPYVAPPISIANDNVSGATALTVNSSPCTALCGTYYSSSNATNSGIAGCSGIADDDVWFSFVATNSSTTIKVLGSGGYDPVVELFTNGMASIACANATGTGLTETINATTLTQGLNYFVRVYHSGTSWGGSGRFSICINATPLPPANDDCANAISLPVSLTCSPVTGSNTGHATASSGIPICAATGTTPDDDVWYKFVAVNVKEVVTVQSGSGFNAVLQAFSGTCGNLTSIQCVNNSSTGGSESITLDNLVLNQTYYIRVYHAAIGAGTGNFTICVTSPAPICPNTFSPPQATSNVSISGITLSWNSVPNAHGYNVYLDTINPAITLIGSNVQGTSMFSGPLLAGATYYWRVAPVNATGAAQGCINLAFATEPFQHGLQVKVFLESLYKGNRKMVSSISPSGLDTIADTVTVCLASPTSPFSILHTSKTVLSTNGIAIGYFSQPALAQSYYIVVKHRFSLDLWSATPFQFNDPDTLYNFADSLQKAFGSNQVLIDSALWAMHSGDVNLNGVI